MINNKGFSLVEFLLLVLVVSFLGFSGWYVYNQSSTHDSSSINNSSADNDVGGDEASSKQANSGNEVNATEDLEEGWKEYVNDNFKFSLAAPFENDINPMVQDYDNPPTDFASGQSLSLEAGRGIFITARSGDFMTQKGPQSLREILAGGYHADAGKYYAEDAKQLRFDATKVDNISGLFVKNTPEFDSSAPTDYFYVFNTGNGGLVIATQNPESLELLRDIAATVQVR